LTTEGEYEPERADMWEGSARRDPDMTPLRALNDACRAMCGDKAMHTGRHDDACLALREVFYEWARLSIYGEDR